MSELQREIHKCVKCIFVANRDFIFVPDNLVKEALNNDYNPVFINFFTLPGWSGHAAFYGFICQECGSFSVDYPHGYTGPGYLFLTCQTCDINLILDNFEFAEIYKREYMQPPPTIRQLAKFLAGLWDKWDKIVKSRKN